VSGEQYVLGEHTIASCYKKRLNDNHSHYRSAFKITGRPLAVNIKSVALRYNNILPGSTSTDGG